MTIRTPTQFEMTKITPLQESLKRIDLQLGYQAVPGSNFMRYEVFGSPLGKSVPGKRYKKIDVEGSDLLKEMESLALYYKIMPPTRSSEPPHWLHKEGSEFWNCVRRRETERGLPLALGKYCRRFGPRFSFTLSLKDSFASTQNQIRLQTSEHHTQEYIVWADVQLRIHLQAYKYLSTDEREYRTKLEYEACMDFNRSMYTYVELRKIRPSGAYEKWKIENRKYHQAALTLILVSLAGPL